MTDASVVIIGGGVMGVSLLFHLTEAGWKDVALLEKNDLTHGSTWHAAGLCTHFAHNPTIQELRARSVRLYRDELPARTGESCGFHPSGAMRITRNPDRMDEFRHVAGLSKFTGYNLEVLDVDRIAALHPLTMLDGLIGGIYEPDDGHVDPTLATNAMAALAIKNGGTINRYDPVRAIKRENDHWLIESERSTLCAQHVVNASGTWCWEVGKMMGLNLPVVPCCINTSLLRPSRILLSASRARPVNCPSSETRKKAGMFARSAMGSFSARMSVMPMSGLLMAYHPTLEQICCHLT